MSSFPGSIAELIVGLFWPDDPTTQTAIVLLISLAAVMAATIYLPLILRLLQIGQLRSAVQACFDDEGSNAIQRQEVGNAFSESPLAYQWGDFVRRWQNAIAADPIQNASLPELSRAPVRLIDVLQEHPLVPAGPRRSLLPALPAIFLSAGLLGAFAGLVLALPGIGMSLDPASHAGSRSQQIISLMDHLGMALRIGLWGLLLSLGAAITGRFIEGRADSLAETLDSWVQLAYGAISTGELTTRTAHEHRASLARLQDDVAELLRHASGRPRPLIRSTAVAPGSAPVSGEAADPKAIERAVEALGDRLSERLERGAAEQVAALREAIAAGTPNPDRPSDVSGDLAAAVEQLVRSKQSEDEASRSLARTVANAAEELRSGLDEFADVMTQLRETGAALGLAAQRLDGGQATSSRALEELRASVEGLAGPLEDRLDAAVASLRGSIESLADLEVPPTPVAEAESEPETLPASRPEIEPGFSPESDFSPEPEFSPEPASRPEPAEADTIPSMRAPTPEMIYAARASDEPPASPSPPPASPPQREAARSGEAKSEDAGGTLSGLLRATHHSGPSSPVPDPDPDRPDFDPEATVILPRADSTERLSVDHAERRPSDAEEDETPDDGESRRRGFFGRRK